MIFIEQEILTEQTETNQILELQSRQTSRVFEKTPKTPRMKTKQKSNKQKRREIQDNRFKKELAKKLNLYDSQHELQHDAEIECDLDDLTIAQELGYDIDEQDAWNYDTWESELDAVYQQTGSAGIIEALQPKKAPQQPKAQPKVVVKPDSEPGIYKPHILTRASQVINTVTTPTTVRRQKVAKAAEEIKGFSAIDYVILALPVLILIFCF